jgi:hypothetical protein
MSNLSLTNDLRLRSIPFWSRVIIKQKIKRFSANSHSHTAINSIIYNENNKNRLNNNSFLKHSLWMSKTAKSPITKTFKLMWKKNTGNVRVGSPIDLKIISLSSLKYHSQNSIFSISRWIFRAVIRKHVHRFNSVSDNINWSSPSKNSICSTVNSLSILTFLVTKRNITNHITTIADKATTKRRSIWNFISQKHFRTMGRTPSR